MGGYVHGLRKGAEKGRRRGPRRCAVSLLQLRYLPGPHRTGWGAGVGLAWAPPHPLFCSPVVTETPSMACPFTPLQDGVPQGRDEGASRKDQSTRPLPLLAGAREDRVSGGVRTASALGVGVGIFRGPQALHLAWHGWVEEPGHEIEIQG